MVQPDDAGFSSLLFGSLSPESRQEDTGMGLGDVRGVSESYVLTMGLGMCSHIQIEV